jgi:predicted acetyltransferase
VDISTTSDIEAFVRPCCIAFGIQVSAALIESTAKLMDAERAHVAYADGKIVGAAGAYSHTLTVPGGVVAAAAVFGVGVLPSHRRRGILTRLKETQLMDARRRGEPIAYLWASEGSIYGRFGYGMASQTMCVSVQTRFGRLRGSPNRLGSIRMVEQNEAYEQLAPIYSRVGKEYPGMFRRSEEW